MAGFRKSFARETNYAVRFLILKGNVTMAVAAISGAFPLIYVSSTPMSFIYWTLSKGWSKIPMAIFNGLRFQVLQVQRWADFCAHSCICVPGWPVRLLHDLFDVFASCIDFKSWTNFSHELTNPIDKDKRMLELSWKLLHKWQLNDCNILLVAG